LQYFLTKPSVVASIFFKRLTKILELEQKFLMYCWTIEFYCTATSACTYQLLKVLLSEIVSYSRCTT